ncbi:MAG: cbb3-type cytochrome c oxidase subunit I [Alphaproteobacteria bacterium]|nr:cbb3-type cytochrome c oxidase subunit I [Alphaproteobacteria bacterium]
MAVSEEFRVCPDTGFRIHLPAQRLMQANAVLDVVFLLIGGIFGLGVALTRWPSVHLLPAEWFYIALTAHGTDILVVWIVFFEVAILYFASSVLLNCRLAAPKIAWLAFVLMVVGALMANVMVLLGQATVMFTAYVPMKAHPLFYLGLILFAVGALLACFVFLGTLVIAKQEKTYEGSIPLVTFGALTAAIIAIFTIASGAIILVPTLLWSVGYIGYIDPLMYKVVFWAFGHSSQQINVATHISIWYASAAILFGAKPLSEKVSRSAFLLYILFLQLASAHHLLVEPGISSEWKIFNTSYAMYLAVLASMIHGLTVPGAIEAAQRKKGYNKGLFEWLRKAPWGNPVFSGMILSVFMFGFLGGISGVTMGVEQINLIIHNTIYVPGHFHGTVAVGTTLAFMGVSYWVVPFLWQKELFMPGMAKLQPYMFGFGMGFLSLFLMGAGTLGVPRRHWDMDFADAVLNYKFPAAAHLLMGLSGVAAIVGSIGALMFILVIVGTILFGKPKVLKAAPATVPAPGPAAAMAHGSAGTMAVPGTFVLALVFLATFVLYYYVNWKYLSVLWLMK